ncbi:hypothetical protein ZIOFF_012410 [Zingiber officinale]|uniref:Uncharacterized protein n=1 Tax=Zingiber officinale TaxID=94328 RepID=A0A8J5HLM1_ZINOF|nr:hypothetical protein ZIOFF_012410 [Zingiber officinale]
MRTTVVARSGPVMDAAFFSARPFVLVAVVLVEGLLLVEDAALLGALPVEELVIDCALLPCDLLLGPPEAEDERLLRRLRLPRRRRRRRQFVKGLSITPVGRLFRVADLLGAEPEAFMLDLGGFPTPVAGGSVKRSRTKDSECPRSERKTAKRENVDYDPDLDLSRDIKGIISALHQIKEKAAKDGQKKTEETIKSVNQEIQSMVDDAKLKFDKERQGPQALMKALLKSSKECEGSLKAEYSKFQAAYEQFSKDKQAHVQNFKDIYSKYEHEKEKLSVRYEQNRKKEKATLSELEKACVSKLANAEETLKRKKQDDVSFNILRKSLGSFFDNASDEDFGPDE